MCVNLCMIIGRCMVFEYVCLYLCEYMCVWFYLYMSMLACMCLYESVC